MPPGDPAVARAAAWLAAIQRPDGGWGEDAESYEAGAYRPYATGLPSQTAWAMLGLIAAGQARAPSVARGADFLLAARGPEGWCDPGFNAVGVPRVLTLHYHGYPSYFPLLALAAYRRQTSAAPDRSLDRCPAGR